jgi:STE24 endopeptidase
MEDASARPQLDPARVALARAYARERRRLIPINLALSLAFFLVWWTLCHRPLVVWVEANLANADLQVLVYVSGFGLAAMLLSLPLEMVEHTRAVRYRLSVQTWPAWFADQAKSLAVGAVIGLPMVLILYRLLAAAPTTWWLWMGLLYLALAVVLAQLAPVLIMPLFLKFTPFDDEPLAARLRELAARAGAQVAGVFRTDLSTKTTAANAWLSGLGRTRRIVLADTLIDHYPADEILSVFAHELGHHVHWDIWRGLLISAAVGLAGFWMAGLVVAWAVARFGYAGPADLSVFPWLMLALTLFGILSSPLLNGISRRQERAADHYALAHGPGPAAFADALTRLANQNLADPEPPGWLVWFSYSHPPILERIARAEGGEVGK